VAHSNGEFLRKPAPRIVRHFPGTSGAGVQDTDFLLQTRGPCQPTNSIYGGKVGVWNVPPDPSAGRNVPEDQLKRARREGLPVRTELGPLGTKSASPPILRNSRDAGRARHRGRAPRMDPRERRILRLCRGDRAQLASARHGTVNNRCASSNEVEGGWAKSGMNQGAIWTTPELGNENVSNCQSSPDAGSSRVLSLNKTPFQWVSGIRSCIAGP
jgi:hypothetical protein